MRYKIDPEKEQELDQDYWSSDESESPPRHFEFWERWALMLSREHEERLSELKSEGANYHGEPKDADPMLLYQFDDIIEDVPFIHRLKPEIVTIIWVKK